MTESTNDGQSEAHIRRITTSDCQIGSLHGHIFAEFLRRALIAIRPPASTQALSASRKWVLLVVGGLRNRRQRAVEMQHGIKRLGRLLHGRRLDIGRSKAWIIAG